MPGARRLGDLLHDDICCLNSVLVLVLYHTFASPEQSASASESRPHQCAVISAISLEGPDGSDRPPDKSDYPLERGRMPLQRG